jgi:hypothetical protein
MDNRFSRIGESVVRYKERRENEERLVIERKVVKKLLLGLGMNRVSLAVQRPDSKDDDGSYMTFDWLYSQYPSFPLVLVVREAWHPSVEDFFKARSRKNSFWPVWEELTECYKGNDKSVGCVFPFVKDVDMGLGIVHTLDLPHHGVNQAIPFARMQMTTNIGLENEVTLTLEQLDCFINRLGRKWEAT